MKAVTVIRHQHRATDEEGRLVADIADYEAVYDLVAGVYQSSVTGLTDGVTDVVTKIADRQKIGPDDKITYAVLARELGIHRDLVRRRVASALSNGWLVNNESRKNHQADLALGDPLPEQQGLPKPETLCHPVTVITDGDVVNTPFQPNETDLGRDKADVSDVSLVSVPQDVYEDRLEL